MLINERSIEYSFTAYADLTYMVSATTTQLTELRGCRTSATKPSTRAGSVISLVQWVQQRNMMLKLRQVAKEGNAGVGVEGEMAQLLRDANLGHKPRSSRNSQCHHVNLLGRILRLTHHTSC